MGHIRLTRLPASKPWNEVVELIAGKGTPSDVIAGSAFAAESSFQQLVDNPVFRECLNLLIAIPRAAASDDFTRSLSAAMVDVPPEPGVIDLISGSLAHLDDVARSDPKRNDLGELASRAYSETMTTAICDRLPGLFGAESDDVRRAAAALASPGGFRELSRAYFGGLCRAILSYWLDRTLATHVGPGKRFGTAVERTAFDKALHQFCAEATRIIDEFSAGWYAKNVFFGDAPSGPNVPGFGAIAVRKVVSELQRKHGPHG